MAVRGQTVKKKVTLAISALNAIEGLRMKLSTFEHKSYLKPIT